jgi:hypothetical protein
MSHLSQCEIQGTHKRFDIPPDKVLKFQPILEFSSIQMGHFLLLTLVLDFPPPHTDDGNCLCRKANDASGHHQLNCSLWAGRTWAQEHNLVVTANGFESRRLGLSVVDIDTAMRLNALTSILRQAEIFLF